MKIDFFKNSTRFRDQKFYFEVIYSLYKGGDIGYQTNIMGICNLSPVRIPNTLRGTSAKKILEMENAKSFVV